MASPLNPGIPLPLITPFGSPLTKDNLTFMQNPNSSDALVQTAFADDNSLSNKYVDHEIQFCPQFHRTSSAVSVPDDVPRHIQGAQYKQSIHIICQYLNPKEYCIGPKLPTRHPLHTKTNLQFLDPVFAALSPLVVPFYNLFFRFTTVRRNHRIPFWTLFIVKQINKLRFRKEL